MPTGLFKTPDQSVQVEYDGVSIPIPRSTYEKNGYKPDFDKLIGLFSAFSISLAETNRTPFHSR